MGAHRSRKSRRKAQVANLFVYLLVAILVVAAAVFGYHWLSFSRGHRAFLKGDCITANRYFERVSSSPSWLRLGSFAAMAEAETAECQLLLQAIDLERSGDYSQALQSYLEFLESRPESGLSAAIQARSTALFALADPYDLVNEVICTSTAALLEKRLIPQRELNLPELYLACAHFYDQAQEEQKAYAAYVTFLSEYPEHKSGREAEAALVENPLACQKPELLSASPLGERPDFIPRLYYTCGLNYESAGDLASAIRMFVAFLNAYPEHRFASQMMTSLARASVAQAETLPTTALPQPPLQGRAAGDLAETTIRNGTPYPLRITFYGPEARVAELPACEDCRAGLSCLTSSPEGQFRLQPGEYRVVVQANPPEALLIWLGTWVLEEKSRYSSCFTAP